MPQLLSTSFEWVEAAPFRAHARNLVATTGLPWRAVAIAARVPSRVVGRLVGEGTRSGRVRSSDAERLLELTPERLARRGRLPVASTVTTAMVRILMSAGFTAAQVAHMLECDLFAVTALQRGRWSTCPLELEWRSKAAAEAFGLAEFGYDACDAADDELDFSHVVAA